MCPLCLLLLFAFLTSTLQACNVGDDYEAQNGPVNNNIGGKWYLNVAVPATCSGSIESYQVQFYDDDFKSGRTYGVTLSVWRPIANNPTSYEKDSLTIQQYQYQHTNKRRRKRAIIASSTPTFSSAVGVRRGSVIGVYLSNPNPLEVIGDRPDGSDINGVPVGVCVTTASASTSTLTCTGSNQPSYVMHAEANISVVDCGAPPSVLNATHSQLDGDTEYGARVQYNCDTGYNINGNDIISCLLNASWFLPTPSCSLVDCGNPGEPANGYTNDNVFTYQSTVQYHCNEGYQLSGDSSIECTSNVARSKRKSNKLDLPAATTNDTSVTNPI
uniref:Sushi domain-containing protein n=1 Tax=Amphimedon queenslandica TaxID=400682 RepID=A0A1X7V158_AMPQE